MGSTDGYIEGILADLARLSEFSDEGAGVSRLAYSEHDELARDWFAERCAELGLTLEIDRYGNCFGWPDRADDDAVVLVGSHLDTVPHGGAYDGTLGVAVGFELARRAGGAVAVVAFACEESSRFGIGAVGSALWAGRLDDRDCDVLADRDGVTLRTWLARNGLDRYHTVDLHARDVAAYVEVHVDQGSTLAATGSPVGLVPAITGIVRTRVVWTGEASHSGAHTRERRRDALRAAATFIVSADELWAAHDAAGRVLAVTVGAMTVRPNSPNTVPGEVEIVVDLRSPDAVLLATAQESVESLAAAAAATCGVTASVEPVGEIAPALMDPVLVRALERSGRELGIRVASTPSLAGHDAEIVSSHFPTAMLFVANPAGVSHNPAEAIDHESLDAVVRLLDHALPSLVAELQATRS